MSKIKFMVDSTSDIPKEVAEKYNVSVVGLSMTFEDGTYTDWYELSGKAFYDKLRASKAAVTTSQPPMSAIADEMKAILEQRYDEIIFYTISSKGSGTYNCANLAKESVLESYPQAKIHIVDTLTYSYFITMALLRGVQLYEEGKSGEKIVEESVQYLKSLDVVFLVDTLTYLERGGRINKATMILGNMLNIKPVLSVRNGIIDTVDKFRGSKNVIRKLIEKAKSFGYNPQNPDFAIVHSDAEEKANELLTAIREENPNAEPVLFGMLGGAVGAHTGPGVVALFFVRE